MGTFRWLHLSDFHTGKDNYGQKKFFEYILEHVKKKKDEGILPDAVFITGDIADKGMKEQYDVFLKDFLFPLMDTYDDPPEVYMVPGNHDVDREVCRLAAKSLYGVLDEKKSKFFDTGESGHKVRQEILDRFKAFQNMLEDSLCSVGQEIFERGYFTDQINIGERKIGIVGVNTAWLSHSKEDKENLTPGKYMLEEALQTVKDCDYKLVLGHHPLSWFRGAQKQQITAVLSKYKAIYLHGHLHNNSGEYSLSVNTGFLALQSGAAFQEREDEVYYNALQWGELLLEEDTVRVIPERWSVSGQHFVADSSERLPDEFREKGRYDSWLFPCTVAVSAKATDHKAEPQAKVPFGWRRIDGSSFKSDKEPSTEDILKYFDGKEPSYEEIFSSYIPVRRIVRDIRDEFVRTDANNMIQCSLITGAGGEGKTTVLLQVAGMLAKEDNWQALVLRQVDKDFQLQEEQLLSVTREGRWVICVDNCFPVSEGLFELLKKLEKRGQRHVHLLLCARDIDWNNGQSGDLSWADYANFRAYRLRGIDREDAEKIVKAWERLGEKGLGKLKDLSISEATEQLVRSAKNEEGKYGASEGALLGAMLTTRYGEELQNHIRNMILRLQAIPVGHVSLLDVFVYIVAMHSERLYFLTKTVIAQLFDYALKDVKKYILGPLGDEAASAVSGDKIFTRHILIAQSARKILDEEFHVDFDEKFLELVEAAMDAKRCGEFVESIKQWRFMSDHFVQNNYTLAIRLDQKVLSIDPYDPYTIVHLSRLYRDAGQPDMALSLFREVQHDMDHRPFFCEWALSEANADNKAASVCLSAVALSDQGARNPIDVRNACMNLYSIAITFEQMYIQFKKESYLWAARAAVVLGEKIDPKDEGIQKFCDTHQVMADRPKWQDPGIHWDQCLRKGILEAASEQKLDFAGYIPAIENLEYRKVFALAGLASPV
ncbi:MAG: metallophosphoesterase [Acetatifactor muris]|nr:metallophosphoesterase [Acetatifactor muris]MCM1525680.1 metallophosphoesterase [Bacteroides sp.]